MSKHTQQAMELFRQGYNCAQAVLGAFCDDLDIHFESALKMTSSFGGGMGRLREVCGAVTGMFAVAGIKYGCTDPKDHKAKAAHYKRIQDLAAQFRAENASIICKELLEPVKKHDEPTCDTGTSVNVKKHSCVELVGCAARIMEEMIRNNEMEVAK